MKTTDMTAEETKAFLEKFDMGSPMQYRAALATTMDDTEGIEGENFFTQNFLIALGNYRTIHLHDTRTILSHEDFEELVEDIMFKVGKPDGKKPFGEFEAFEGVFKDIATLMEHDAAKSVTEPSDYVRIEIPVIHVVPGEDRHRIYATLFAVSYRHTPEGTFRKMIQRQSTRLV